MRTLAATLTAHQQGTARKPSVLCTVTAGHYGIATMPWLRFYTGSEPDSPHDVCQATDGSLIRARNDAGTIKVSRVTTPGSGSTYSSWSNIATGVSGKGVSVASRYSAGEVLLVYVAGGGTTVELRTSADNGATWSGATTLITETSIDWCAVGQRESNGDACLFYNVGATVQRLRRTAGVWAGAGTAWGSTVGTVTGIGTESTGSNYMIAVTGTVTGSPADKRVWASQLFGSGGLLNVWTSNVDVAQSDELSTTTFHGPHVSALIETPSIYWSAREAGAVAVDRAYAATVPGSSNFTSAYWTEASPHEALTAHGLAATARNVLGPTWATSPDGVWYATRGGSQSLTDRLISCSYTIQPFAAGGHAVFTPAAGEEDDLMLPGATLQFTPGYLSSATGTGQYGVINTFIIDAVTQEIRDGHYTVTVEYSGMWEEMHRWAATQAWQVAAGVDSRGVTFKRILARAGLQTSDSGGTDWTTLTPGFALSPGESGRTAARRLVAVAEEVFVPHGDALEIKPLPTATSYTYGPADHVTTRLQIGNTQREVNWTRAQGAARYADAHDFSSIYRDGPHLDHSRNLDADTDAKADTYAVNALDRRPAAAGHLVAPFNAGQEVNDVVTVDDDRLAASATYRVASAGLVYSRGPQRARYDSVLELVTP